MNKVIKLVLLFLPFIAHDGVCADGAAPSANATADEVAKNFKNFSLDLSVPDSPAFQVLGVNPTTVIHPSTPRELGASIVNAIGRNGELASGVAIDTAPFLLFAGDNLTLRQYRDSYTMRLLTNSQLSLAGVKANGSDTKTTKYGVGLHVTLFNLGDPRNDEVLSSCFLKASQQALPSDRPAFGPNDPPSVREEKRLAAEKVFAREVEACRVSSRARNWNRSSWVVGLGHGFANTTPDTSATASGATSIWTSIAYGFERHELLKDRAQFVAHLRRFTNELVVRDSFQTSKDSTLVGMRFRYGSDARGFSVEGTYSRGVFETGESENIRRLAIGGEFRISKDLWLVLSVGGEGGYRDGRNAPFVLGSFKFGSSSEPVLGLAR